METKIKQIISYIRAQHLKHKDGCKGGCWIQEVGYFSDESDDRESHWFCRFGGYCFGNLSRHEKVTADSLDSLFVKVKEEIERGIREFEEWMRKSHGDNN